MIIIIIVITVKHLYCADYKLTRVVQSQMLKALSKKMSYYLFINYFSVTKSLFV